MMQQPPRQPGGLLGLVAAIPQLIEGIKLQKQQQQLQQMLNANQELDIYRQQAATPGFKPTPDWTAAVTKIARQGGLQLPFTQGTEGGMPGAGVAPTVLGQPGGMTGGSVFQTHAASPSGGPAGGAGVGAASPSQVSDPRLTMINPGKANLATASALPQIGAQTGRPTGPQLDINAFVGKDPFAEFVQKNLGTLEESDPSQRGAVASAELGRPLTADEDKKLRALPSQLPPAQQVAREKNVNTLVNQQLKQAAQSGTASSLKSAVTYASGQIRALYPNTPEGQQQADDAINALLDPALDALTPVELAKLAAEKSTSGLKEAQAQYIRQSAQARIDLLRSQAQEDKDRGAALLSNAATARALIPAKFMTAQAAVKNAYSRAATVASTNADKWAEARYYSAHAQDLVSQGNTRATSAALSSVRAAKSSTDAGIRELQTNIAGIQKAVVANALVDPATKAKSEQMMAGLNQQLQILQSRSTEYDSAISTLTTKLAPGTNLAPAPNQAGVDITGSTPVAPAGTAPAPHGATPAPAQGVPPGTPPGATLNGRPIFVQGGRWVYEDGSTAQ